MILKALWNCSPCLMLNVAVKLLSVTGSGLLLLFGTNMAQGPTCVSQDICDSYQIQ